MFKFVIANQHVDRVVDINMITNLPILVTSDSILWASRGIWGKEGGRFRSNINYFIFKILTVQKLGQNHISLAVSEIVNFDQIIIIIMTHIYIFQYWKITMGTAIAYDEVMGEYFCKWDSTYVENPDRWKCVKQR